MKTTLLLLLLPGLLRADTTLDLSNLEPQPFELFDWDDAAIWDNGVPSAGSNVFIPSQIFELLDPETEEFVTTEIDVNLNLVAPVTIASIDLGYLNEIDTKGHNFFVSGTTTFDGYFTVSDSTASLGTYTNFNPATKTISGGQGHVVSEIDKGISATLEFRGADIEINNTGWNLFGVNAFVRDQDTGLNAFRNLRECNGFFNLADGYNLTIAGHFTLGENGQIWIQKFGRTCQFNVGGNLVNDGGIELYGNSVFNVAGTYSGTGTITSSGGGNQISVVGAHIQNGDMTLDEGDSLDFGANLTLNGNLNLNGDGTVISVGGDMVNNGSLIIVKGDGTRIEVTGDILQTGGTVDTGPSGVDSFVLKARNGVYQNNATISGEGTLIAGNTNVHNSFLTPGNTPGKLSVEGDLTITGSSDLEIELGGTAQGESYDLLAQTAGTTTLGGTLTLKLINDFDCYLTSSHIFTVLTSDEPLAGSFTNVASGARLATEDGLGTFLVSYGAGSGNPNAVVLSDFLAAPVATKTFATWSIEQGFAAPEPEGDQNGNGIPDILDYAFGNSLGKPGVSTMSATGGEFVWTFGIPKYVTGITLRSIVSNELPASEPQIGPVPVPSGSTASRNLHTLTDSITTARKFYQLAVELEE
jgi:hypothetical protein